MLPHSFIHSSFIILLYTYLMHLSHLNTLLFSTTTSLLLFFSFMGSLLGLPLLGMGCEEKHKDGLRRGYENCWEWNYQGMEVKYRGINGYIGLWAIILTLFFMNSNPTFLTCQPHYCPSNRCFQSCEPSCSHIPSQEAPTKHPIQE